jgi:transcriptional regulator with XRE-family HTH domain
MALEKFLDYLAYGEPRPNKFTIFLGEQIKKAREESKMSQKDLAELIYKRQATVSDIENGKGEVDSSTLALLAHVLNKPFGYFYPWYLYKEITQESLTPLENELIIQFRQIWDDTLRKLAIDQIRVLGEFNPKELVANSVEDIAAMVEEEKALLELMRKHRKK